MNEQQIRDAGRPPFSYRRSSTTAHARQLVVLCGLLLALVVTVRGHVTTAPRPPVRNAAVVGGISIPMSRYQQLLGFIRRSPGDLRVVPGSATARTVAILQENQAVNQAIAEALIDQAAATRKISASQSEIGTELALMAGSAGGEQALRSQAAHAGMTEADLRAVARHTVLRNRLAEVLKDTGWLNQAAAAAVIEYYVGYDAVAEIKPSISLGTPAPLFVAADLGGTSAVSAADLGARPLILAFFTTSCDWCLADLGMLRDLARQDPRLAVVALDRGDSPTAVHTYIDAHGLGGLRVWLDLQGAAARDYTADQLPVTFFIDRTGVIRSYNFGPLASMQTLRDQASFAVHGVNNAY